MPARIQSLTFALGSAKQTSLTSISPTFNTWRKLNMDVPFLLAETENDSAEIGKGDEFAHQVFKTAKSATGRIEKYGSAEFTAWGWGYAMGDVGLSAGLYTVHAIDPATTLELPYFSVAALLKEGGVQTIDEAHLGCTVEDVETTFHYGPGRASVRTVVNYSNAGNSLVPSGLALAPPALITENYMQSSSMAITINGTNYASAKSILLGTMGWKNNLLLPLRYRPSVGGLDGDGFAVGGGTLIGARAPSLTITAFLLNTSTEYASLVSQTPGTGVITLTFDGTHFCTWSYPKVVVQRVEKTQEEGIVAVTVGLEPLYDATVVGGKPNGTLVFTSKNAITDIAQ
jgi:hypothetical protein